METPTTLTELIAALRKTCEDYRLDWSQGYDENEIVETLITDIDERETEAEALGLLA